MISFRSRLDCGIGARGAIELWLSFFDFALAVIEPQLWFFGHESVYSREREIEQLVSVALVALLYCLFLAEVIIPHA
jgi:hypothetical protein